MFVDSTFAIESVRSDAIGPRERFAAAAEVCTRILAKENEATIGLVHTHHGIKGQRNGRRIRQGCSRGGRSQRTRFPTSAGGKQACLTWPGLPPRPAPARPPSGYRATLGPNKGTAPPLGKAPGKTATTHEKDKPAATSSSSQDTWRLGPPEDKIGKTDDDRCWWKHPGAPLVKRLWKEKATKAVLKFLRDTRVRFISTKRKPPEEECDGEVSNNDEGEEEGRPGPP